MVVPPPISDLESAQVVALLLDELAPERLEELARASGVELGEASGPTEVLAKLTSPDGPDHEAILEFCSVYELKDICRRLDLPIAGAVPDRLRLRIRTRLYFPPSRRDDPPELRDERARYSRDREARERVLGEDQRCRQRGFAIAGGALAGLGAVFSPWLGLPVAAVMVLAGACAGHAIYARQLGHLASAAVFGGAVIGGNIISILLAGIGLFPVVGVDIFLWLVSCCAGALISIVAEHSEECAAAPVPHLVEYRGPTRPRPLIELIEMLPAARLNSLALETDLPVDRETPRAGVVKRLADAGVLTRARILDTLTLEELEEIARKLEVPGSSDDQILRARLAAVFPAELHPASDRDLRT